MPRSARSARREFSLSQLPWGVFGVAAVILALAIGAALLLRDVGSRAFSPVVITATPDAPIRTQTALAQVAATQAAAETRVANLQASVTATTIPPTSRPAPPTLTPIPPVEYTVQDGDTCGGIADKYSIGLHAFLAYNNLDENNCLIRVGDKVKIPPPTPTAGPSPTLPPGVTQQPAAPAEATATLPPQIVVVVRSGDTCGAIALKYRISVDTLVQQNNLNSDCSLQIGEVLTLTFATAAPSISPTPIVAQTPTPRTGFEAPNLTSPRDGVQITETEDVVTLQWLSVGLLKNDEWYIVQVQPSGAITVPIFATKATSIKITRDIFGDLAERSFAWWVQIKQDLGADAVSGEHAYTSVSAPSAVRRFTWRRPALTPTPASQ